MVSFLKGEDWKRVRTIITPAFTSKRMREMSHIINESSQSVVDTFGKYADLGETVDCKEVFGAFSMDVIASAAFGTKVDSHNDPDNVFVRNVKNGFFQGSFRRFLTFLILPNWIIRRYRLGSLSAMDFFKNVVSQVVAKRKELKIRYNDVLQLFMDAQDPLPNESLKQRPLEPDDQEDVTDHFGSVTNDDVTESKLKYGRLSDEEFFAQCILFFFVGYETTATSLAYLAYCLALNPDCQDTLIKEVDEVFERHKELHYDVIRDMKYLDCVVSETLRMFPVVARWLRKNDDYWKKRGMTYMPRLSHFAFLKQLTFRPLFEVTQENRKKYGRIFGEFEFRKPALSVSDPDLLKDILVKDFHSFSCRKEQFFGEPMLDSMLFSMNGEEWKRVRTIMTPAFTSKRMRQMSYIINESSKTVLENLEKYAETGDPADCKKIFGAFTMDVIANAAFATKIDSHNDPDNLFVRHVRKLFEVTSLLHFMLLFFMPAWFIRTFRFGVLKSLDFYKGVVLDVIKERKKGGKKFNDFLQLVLDAQEECDKEGSKEKTNEQEDEADHFGSVSNGGATPQLKYTRLSEEELVAQCVLFFIVGYETTASIMAHVAYCLALHQECQEKLIKEVDEAFEKNNEFNHDVIRDMKYLDCVISETLRMYPSAPSAERTAVEDYHLRKSGTVVEKGVIIKFHIYVMHHDPEFFTDPEKFDPERFFPENVSHPQYAYLPFGAGPRNCLGMRFALMEIKICICNLLRHYRFKRAPTTKVPLEYISGGFMTAKEVPLLFERRKDHGKTAN